MVFLAYKMIGSFNYVFAYVYVHDQPPLDHLVYRNLQDLNFELLFASDKCSSILCVACVHHMISVSYDLGIT